MALIVRAFPVLPGKEQDALKFARECDARGDETSTFLKSYGVRRETWHLQRTAQGSIVIVVTDVEEPPLEKAAAYGASQGVYERWFKDGVRSLCGIDPDSQPLGPPTETIFQWDTAHNRRRSFDAPRAG